MPQVESNLKSVRERIREAAQRSGRSDGAITLVAVTKTQSAELIRRGIAAGITVLGENRVQEAAGKMPLIPEPAAWHLIGHLQSNKARKAVELFTLIQSIDSAALAREVGRRAGEAGKVQDILVEVNTSGEASKHGLPPETALDALREMAGIEGISIQGLMTVGPLTEDVEQVRRSFQTLRKTFDHASSLGVPGVEMRHLSMGMSGDFEIAIEEGATMVRIGSAIFGLRS